MRRGVSYDVGRVPGGNWRPTFDRAVVHRELEIIAHDLHCNAVRICGRDIGRLVTAAEDALDQELEVWLSPELWDPTTNTGPCGQRSRSCSAAVAALKRLQSTASQTSAA